MKTPPWLPLNSALARPLIPLFVRGGVSANAVTLLSMAAGIFGAVCLAQGGARGTLLGAVGFLLANVLDECDGKVARQTGTASQAGALLDTWADFIVHIAFFLGLGIGMTRHLRGGPWLMLSGVAAAGNLISFVLDLRGLSGVEPRGPNSAGSPDRFAWMTEWFRIDFSVLVVVSALFGCIRWILWAGAVGVFLVWIPSTVAIAARHRP